MFCGKKVLVSVIKACKAHICIGEIIGRYIILIIKPKDAWPAILGTVVAAFVIKCDSAVCM